MLAFNQAIKDRFLNDLNFDLKVGHNMLEIPSLPNTYVEKWKSLYDRCFNGEKINAEISPSEQKDLKPTWIQANLTPIYENEEIIGLVCHSSDITEKVQNKKSIENALVEKKNILDSISDAFYALDKNYNFTYVNESALKTMRKDQNDLIGKNAFKEFPQLKNTVFKDYLEDAKRTGKPAQFEFYYEYYHLWFDESIYPSEDGFSVYYKDITNRKNNYSSLRRSIQKGKRNFREYFRCICSRG